MNILRRHAIALPFIPLQSLLAAPLTQAQATVQDEEWLDAARQRTIPVRIRWPAPTLAAPATGWPVVLFSHGLGGTRDGGQVWGKAWAEAGFVVVHLQHAGSDLQALQASGGRFTDPAALRRVGGGQQLLARLQDAAFVLDELGRRHAAGQAQWATVRPLRAGMSGHSFGAYTTLGMAGQRYPAHKGFEESRLAAFIAFSPSLPASGDARHAFERINHPMLCLTGTRDADVAGTGATPERRKGVFAELPAGQKAQLVLQDADHMTFAGQTGRSVEIIAREAVTRALQIRHHEAVAALTTDWWRAHLLADGEARQRLSKPAGLAAGDVWQMG